MKVLTDARPKWHELGLNYTGNGHQFPRLYHGHCTKGTQTGFALDWARKGLPVIMPMRHPYRVEESWRRRERDMAGLLPAYENMLDVLRPHVRCWLPVDAAPLVCAVAEDILNDIVGRRLRYPWRVVENSVGGTCNLQLADTEPSDAIKEIRRHPLFTEVYGDADEEADDIRREQTVSREARIQQGMEVRQPEVA